jgi:hypothetical protein
MFYTGSDESPVKQFELLQKTVVKTNSEGKYVYFKNTFTAAERTALASGAGTPYGTFFFEVFSSNSFSGTARAELSLTPSGDCNGDGVQDSNQIASGELVDLNINGVPDLCETSFNSVLPAAIPSQGGSPLTIRGRFPATPSVIIDGVPALSVTRQSLTQIVVTSPPLSPGLKVVQVDGFSLAEALYVHPVCNADIDQNGFLDMADVSLLLLDFGPCTGSSPALTDMKPALFPES